MSYKLFNERARELAEVKSPLQRELPGNRVLSARTIKKDGTVRRGQAQDIRDISPYTNTSCTTMRRAWLRDPAIEDD